MTEMENGVREVGRPTRRTERVAIQMLDTFVTGQEFSDVLEFLSKLEEAFVMPRAKRLTNVSLRASGALSAVASVPSALTALEADALTKTWRQRCFLADGTGLGWIHNALLTVNDAKELEARLKQKVRRDLYLVTRAL
jgi:hypothetical protein